MKLKKIKISNYRSFGAKEEVIEIDKITTFIGNNSSGKTSALCALACLFSQNSNERILKRSDFHLPNNKKPEEIESVDLYIEAVFSFDELEKAGDDAKSSVPNFFSSLTVEEEGGVLNLRVRLEARWEKSSNIEGSIDSKIVYITCPENVNITDENKKMATRRDLDCIRVIYVPAFRDPSKQLKNVSGTLMHQIMSAVNWKEETKKEVKQKIEDLNELFKKESGISMFDDSISRQWMMYDSDERYSKAQLRFNSMDIDESLKRSEVVFLPTVTEREYEIDEMGDGLRSLFYISMVDSILDLEEKIKNEKKEDDTVESFNIELPILTMILLEEPENHISPHLIGKMMKNLIDISKRENAQIILTSHSPSIVKRIEPENLRYFRLDLKLLNTNVTKIIMDEKITEYKYIKEAVMAYPELYFAKLVILGEGDSEEIILDKYIEVSGKNIDSSGISIVPLGGRFVNHFWRLLENLKIPYITLLDLDKERFGGDWGRIKYAIRQLIKNKKVILPFKIKEEEITNEIIDKLDSKKIESDEIKKWLDFLEEYDIFYSTPLDIDFLMLENMLDNYISILQSDEGPRILVKMADGKKRKIKIEELNREKFNIQFNKRIREDVHNTLKKRGGTGKTYTKEQKELMIWYNYFFLNRGKPSTHIIALSQMDDKKLKEKCPDVINRLIEKINKKLGEK